MKFYAPKNESDACSRINIVAENPLDNDFVDFIMLVLGGKGSLILYDDHGKQIASYEHGFGVSLP